MDCNPPGSCPWGFSRKEYSSGLPCPPPGDLLNPEIKPRSPTIEVDFFFEGSLQSENAFTQIVGKKEGSSALIANDLEQQQVELKQQAAQVESTCRLLSSEEEQEEISW